MKIMLLDDSKTHGCFLYGGIIFDNHLASYFRESIRRQLVSKPQTQHLIEYKWNLHQTATGSEQIISRKLDSAIRKQRRSVDVQFDIDGRPINYSVPQETEILRDSSILRFLPPSVYNPDEIYVSPQITPEHDFEIKKSILEILMLPEINSQIHFYFVFMESINDFSVLKKLNKQTTSLKICKNYFEKYLQSIDERGIVVFDQISDAGKHDKINRHVADLKRQTGFERIDMMVQTASDEIFSINDILLGSLNQCILNPQSEFKPYISSILNGNYDYHVQKSNNDFAKRIDSCLRQFN